MCRAVDAGRAGSTAPEEFVAAVCALLPIMCCVLETLSMMLLTLPVIDSSLDALGIDPIRSGVILTPTIECAPIAPSVGLNLFVIRAVAAQSLPEGVAEATLGEAARGAVRRPAPVDRFRRRCLPASGPVHPLRLKAGAGRETCGRRVMTGRPLSAARTRGSSEPPATRGAPLRGSCRNKVSFPNPPTAPVRGRYRTGSPPEIAVP